MSSPSPEQELEASLRRLEWQPVLLAETPKRLELLGLSPSWATRPLRVRVHRNTAFEHVTALVAPFLAYAGFSATFEHGDYDDSLTSLSSGGDGVDVELVWLDLDRYGSTEPAALADWLVDRLHVLRGRSLAPVLVADWPGPGDGPAAFNARLAARVHEVPDVVVADVSSIAERLGDRFLDLRAREAAGTGMSARAAVLAAQRLGLRWLPALVAPRVKALAVDLDMTLYQGVLGEDGPDGVVLTPEHQRLQTALRDLRDAGVLLAVVSRNEPGDVERLFARRPDFPLRLDHFSARAIGWGRKSDGVAAVAAAMRISPDAVVFVDDNVGELAEVADRVRVAGVLHAADPAATTTALSLFPGLHGHVSTQEDTLRARDLAAAAQRAQAPATDPVDYLRSLQVHLDLALDLADHLPRMADLAAKTNQFNAALRRTGSAEFARWLADPGVHVVTAALRDRLSDSGIVAVVAGRRSADGRLLVEELCISCRALGRGIEDALIGAAVGALLTETGADVVAVRYRPGPRNEPARAWLAEHAAGPVSGPGEVVLGWDRDACDRLVRTAPVALNWKGRT